MRDDMDDARDDAAEPQAHHGRSQRITQPAQNASQRPGRQSHRVLDVMRDMRRRGQAEFLQTVKEGAALVQLFDAPNKRIALLLWPRPCAKCRRLRKEGRLTMDVGRRSRVKTA